MKLIILTSSIFYLLGLKLTHQVQIEQPFDPDSSAIIIPMEQPKLPELAPNDQQLQINKVEADSIQTSGSNESTAPWYPFIEGQD